MRVAGVGVDVQFEIVVVFLQLGIARRGFYRGDRQWAARWSAVGGFEFDVLPGALDGVAVLVHEAVVATAQQDEVVELGFSTVSPVDDVMRVDEAGVAAAWITATRIPRVERAPEG